jgi:hypothetical protein
MFYTPGTEPLPGRKVVPECYPPLSAFGLPDGNILLSDREKPRLAEVTRNGKVTRERKTLGRPWLVQVVP